MSITINHQTNTISPSSDNMVVASFSATASGAITAGNPVVINSNGTVSAGGIVGPTYGTQQQYSPSTVGSNASCYNTTDNTIITVYIDTALSSKLYARVGTISGTTVTYGTATVLDNSNTYANGVVSCCYVPTTNGFIAVVNNNIGTIVRLYACTVSGTTITVGTATGSPVVGSTHSITYDSSANKVALLVNSTVYTATVSGTTITFAGTSTSITNPPQRNALIKYHSTMNKYFVLTSASSGIYIQPGTLSVDTITWDTAYQAWNAGNSIGYFDPIIGTNYVAFSKFLYTGSCTSEVIDFTSTPTSGGAVSFGNDLFYNTTAVYDQYSGGVLVLYQGASNYATTSFAAVTGTTVGTFGTATVVYSGTAQYVSAIYAGGTTQKSLINSQLFQAGSIGYVFLIQPAAFTNLTATNYIGMSPATYANAATATVITAGGVSANQSGLTPGQQYYLQTNGTLSTTPGTPSVFAGTALTATSLIVKG